MAGTEFEVHVVNELKKIEQHLAALVKLITARLPPVPPTGKA